MELKIVQLLFVFILCFNYSDTKTVVDSSDLGISDFIKENFQASEVDNVMDETRKIKISESDARALVDKLINIVERYAYLDIIKNPPQPKLNYFNTIDLVEQLKHVNTEERAIYDLFRDINLIISQCQEGHFSIDYNKEILNGYKFDQMLFFVFPIEYEITKNGIYSKPSYLSGLFDKVQELINQIKQKEGKKINGLDPLEYIQKINKGFIQLKSPQAQFVSNTRDMVGFSLSSYQFEKEDLKDITISYEDSTYLKYYYKMGCAEKKINNSLIILLNILSQIQKVI